MLKNQLAYLPDLSDLRPEANIDDAIVGEPGESDPEEEERLRAVLRKHRMIFLGEGNALPPPALGVVCDLDIGDEKPTSMRSRRIPADLLSKVYELLKRLLETGLIEYSNSEWASAIVLVMKKNGTDVRLCIDYRLVNQLIKLMNYPLPLIDELMSNFAATMWFMTLDMASGFWAVPMTARAQLISAFICPLGHFQWKRMPFGLKNA
ncbi:reverse transcriptase, partial [Phytophthora megakarya]